MKKHQSILLFFVAMFCCHSTYTQNLDKLSIEELDSIWEDLDVLGKHPDALIYAQALCDKTQQKGKDSIYANALNKKATTYYYMGKYEQTEKYWEEAKNIFERVSGKKSYAYATSVNNLAVLYYEISRHDEAAFYYLEAKDIFEAIQGKNSDEYAATLNNLGMLNKEMGKYEQAELLLLEAKEIRAKINKEDPEYTISLNNLGFLYHDMGRYTEALKLYKEAQNIKEKIIGKEHPEYALGLNNMAAVYKVLEDFDQAEKLYWEAIKIQEKTLGKMHPAYARSINNLATLYTTNAEFAKSEKLFLEAKSIRLQSFGKEHPLYARSLNALASLYANMGKLDTAFAYYLAVFDALSPDIDSSFSDFSKIDQYEYYSEEYAYFSCADVIPILEKLYQKTGKQEIQEQIYALIKASLRLMDRIKKSFTTEENKIRVLQKSSHFCAKGIQMALLINADSSAYEAFSFSEQNKSMLISDALKGQRARAFGDLPDSLSLKEINLQKEWDKLKKQQAEAKDSLSKAQVNAEMNQLNQQIEAFKKSLVGKYPKYHQQKYAHVTSNGKDVQALLSDKMAFLEYFVSDSVIHLFALTRKDIQFFSFPISKTVFQKEVERLRRCLTDYDYIKQESDKAYNDYTEIAHIFYKKYIQVAVNQLKGRGIEHLVIVPDNLLGHIPFEALLVEPAAAGNNYSDLHYLIKDFKISYNYSATLWKENKQNKKAADKAEILAFAADYAQVKEEILKKKDLRSQKLRSVLAPLPAAESEVMGLSNIFKGQFLSREQANESQFKSLAPQYGVIHLAMHGILDSRYPILSALAFSENGDSIENNFLQAYEISHLQLNADLVVLSACETGYGKFQQGEGVISLARSFMYAGTPALVVSLWQVNDASTASIMQNFYENLSQGQDKATALQRAKIEYLSNTKSIAAHPAFWAAFVQLGDETAISLNKKGSGRGYIFVLIGGAVLVVLGLFWKKARG